MVALTTMNRICEHLEKYVYDRIWNEPYSEYRTYIRMPIINAYNVTSQGETVLAVGDETIEGTDLHVDDGIIEGTGLCVSDGVISGGVTSTKKYLPAAGYYAGRYSRILLPPFKSNDEIVSGKWFDANTPKFYLFTVPSAFFSPLEIGVLDWTLLSEYCNKNLVDLQVFHKDGTVLNRGYIYIKQSDKNDCMLVAVNAVMYELLAGDADPSETYFGKYYDSDSDPDNVVHAGRLTRVTAKEPIDYDVDNATFVLYNGKLCSGEYKQYFVQNNYLETIRDDDVLATFNVEVLESKGAPIYTDLIKENGSAGSGKQRLLVHIPKEVNPDNYLITPHTCELFLVPRKMSAGNPAISGVYIYPCNRDNQFFQISHSDFAIDLDMLHDIANENLFTDYYLKVFVRVHLKKRVVVRDANYIDILYNLGDEEIMQFLLGKHPWQLNEYEEVEDYIAGTEYYYKSGTAYIKLSISSKTQFDSSKRTYGKLYRHPLPFWRADFLENCKYANALIRRRGGYYQDPYTQCSICPNKDGCTKEMESLKFREGGKDWTMRDQDRLDHLRAYFNVTGYGPEICPKYAKVMTNQCLNCGIRTRCSDIDTTLGKYVTDRICPCYSVRGIQDYVDILGYFHLLALIGKRVSHFRVDVAGTTDVVVFAPLALSYPELDPKDFLPIVYHNGVRIDQSRISFAQTTSGNIGVTEIFSDTGYLKNTGVIQSNYATRLKISIDPKYHVSDHYSCVESGIYYYKDEDENYILARGCSLEEYEKLSPDEKKLIDYCYGDKVHKETYELIDDRSETFLAGLKYYVKDATQPDGYRLLVSTSDYGLTTDATFQAGKDYFVEDALLPEGYRHLEEGVEYTVGSSTATWMTEHSKLLYQLGTDYEIGEDIDEWISTHHQVLYHKWKVFYNPDEEFKQNDMIVVELFDNREKGQVKHYHCTADVETRTVKVATTDQWKVYLMSYDATNKRMSYTYKPYPGLFDPMKDAEGLYTLTIRPDLAGDSITTFDVTVVEGPKVIEETWNRPITNDTFGCIGYDFWNLASYDTKSHPLDMELIFLNGKRLVKNMDYSVSGYHDYSYDTDTSGNRKSIKLFEQNLSYLREENKIDVIRSCTTNISSQYGFLLGKTISWLGRAPLWFDELSTLSIDGVLCSHVTHTFGTVSITDDIHRNGAPYEIRTAVSTRVKEIIGCDDSMWDDKQKILEIRNFFERATAMDPMRVIIPHSHKIYSPYIEAICAAFLDTTGAYKTWDFFRIGETTTRKIGSLPSGTKITAANFDQQFTDWTEFKQHDLFFNKFSTRDLDYIDVYPLYHRVLTPFRETYNKLSYLYTTLMGTKDEIKHKDAPHE